MGAKEFLKKFCPPSARTFHSAQEKISSTQQDIQKQLSANRDVLTQLSAEVSVNRDILAQLSAEISTSRDILTRLLTEEGHYNNHFEYDFLQRNGFFQAVASEDFMDRYIRLVDGLDEESVGTVNRILTRIQIMEKCRKLPMDIYTGEEKRMFAFLEKDFPREILKLSDSCYVYRQYRLPICHFEPCVFLDKHGITRISSNRDQIIQGNIIDAGGFIGDSVLVLSPYTNEKIYTFEPVKKNFDLLQKTIELNHITNAVCEKAALGNQSGIAAFTVQDSCSCRTDSEAEETEKVPVIMLDEYVKEHHLQVGLIKSDLEGMERDFLLGAKETIISQRPVLLLSMYHNDQDFFGLKPLLESWDVGYRFKVFKGLDYGICLETMLIAEVL